MQERSLKGSLNGLVNLKPSLSQFIEEERFRKNKSLLQSRQLHSELKIRDNYESENSIDFGMQLKNNSVENSKFSYVKQQFFQNIEVNFARKNKQKKNLKITKVVPE